MSWAPEPVQLGASQQAILCAVKDWLAAGLAQPSRQLFNATAVCGDSECLPARCTDHGVILLPCLHVTVSCGSNHVHIIHQCAADLGLDALDDVTALQTCFSTDHYTQNLT